jgi:hypothetical protein
LKLLQFFSKKDNKDKYMSQNFLNKYCSPITEEEVIKHFTDHIEQNCINEDNIVQYTMPKEFVDKISNESFWRIIYDFLSCKMDFDYDMGWKMEYIDDIFYKSMNYKEYYTVWERPNPNYPEYTEQLLCFDSTKINKVIFRIYNS